MRFPVNNGARRYQYQELEALVLMLLPAAGVVAVLARVIGG